MYPAVLPVLLVLGVSSLFAWESSAVIRQVFSTPGNFAIATTLIVGGPVCWLWSKVALRLSIAIQRSIIIHVQQCLLLYIACVASGLWLILDQRPISQTEPGIYYVIILLICSIYAAIINAGVVAFFRESRDFAA